MSDRDGTAHVNLDIRCVDSVYARTSAIPLFRSRYMHAPNASGLLDLLLMIILWHTDVLFTLCIDFVELEMVDCCLLVECHLPSSPGAAAVVGYGKPSASNLFIHSPKTLTHESDHAN